MTDTPRPEASSGQAPPRASAATDARLEHQVLALVRNWLRRAREASAARTEAAIDRGSFESFPASDPVASAGSSTDREPSLEEIDCTMRTDRLEFRCAPREPDASRPPPASTIEGDAPGGGRMRLRIWVDDASPESGVPQSLELEPVHASIRPRQHERRVGAERRTSVRKMPAGFDRRVGERRARNGTGTAA
jgi:hypothetical protein